MSYRDPITDSDGKLAILQRLQRRGDWMQAGLNLTDDCYWYGEPNYCYIRVDEISFENGEDDPVIHGMYILECYINYEHDLCYVDEVAPSSQFDYYTLPLHDIVELYADEMYPDAELNEILSVNDEIFFKEDEED